MAAELHLTAGTLYWMRTFVGDDWEPEDPANPGGHPTLLRMIHPEVVEWPLPEDGRWPGTGFQSLGPFDSDVSPIFELIAGPGHVVRSDSIYADNVGSGTTPAPSPYKESDTVPGVPYTRLSWEVTAQIGNVFDRDDLWTYVFGPVSGGMTVGHIGMG